MNLNSPLASVEAITYAIDQVLQDSQARLLQGVRQTLEIAEGLVSLAPTEALVERSDNYTRHLIYTDPLGMYSAMLLVWHPGHRSPIHGHRTWCAYKVLKGSLTERHYEWDAAAKIAVQRGQIQRRAGETVSAPAGLSAIHRLGNDGTEVAVSLHVYGVERERISSHVNIVLNEGYAAMIV